MLLPLADAGADDGVFVFGGDEELEGVEGQRDTALHLLQQPSTGGMGEREGTRGHEDLL